jgi:hypothetical protein
VKRRNEMASYDEMLKLRSVLVEFPEEAADDIGSLWYLVSNGVDVDFESKLERIAQDHNIPVNEVESYYNWYENAPPDKIVIFYDDGKKLKGEPSFDFRKGTQFLPKGVVVCAIVTGSGAVLQAPYIRNSQVDQFKATLQSALICAWVLNYTADDLVDQLILTF